MKNHHGFVEDSSIVYKILRSLYGLKKGPWAWYEKMNSFFLSLEFSQCHYDPIVYVQHLGDKLLIVVLYVDDLIITSNSSFII